MKGMKGTEGRLAKLRHEVLSLPKNNLNNNLIKNPYNPHYHYNVAFYPYDDTIYDFIQRGGTFDLLIGD